MLRQGSCPERGFFKNILPIALTHEENRIFLQELGDGRYLAKVQKPVLQVQVHYFRYSPVDGSFRSMALGEDSLFWGLQFSFPQIYQDPKTHLIQKENITPFILVRKWAKDYSIATPFVVDNKRINVPFRLGKGCFSWIEKHPQLQRQGLSVYVGG